MKNTHGWDLPTIYLTQEGLNGELEDRENDFQSVNMISKPCDRIDLVGEWEWEWEGRGWKRVIGKSMKSYLDTQLVFTRSFLLFDSVGTRLLWARW